VNDVVTSGVQTRLESSKIVLRQGSALDPAGKAYDAPRPPSWLGREILHFSPPRRLRRLDPRRHLRRLELDTFSVSGSTLAMCVTYMYTKL